MFGFSRVWRRKPAAARPKRVQPQLEYLESRDLLAALPITPVLVSATAGREAHVRPALSARVHHSHTIVDFGAIEEARDVWTFRGRVTGGNVAGLTVQLGGLPSLRGRTAVVGPDGWFYLTVRLQPGEDGMATAQTTDSNVARTIVCPTN
jgi:hypothetical protein